MKLKIYLTSIFAAFVLAALWGAVLFLPMRVVVAAPPAQELAATATATHTATPTRTATATHPATAQAKTATPNAESHAGKPTATPFPAIEIGDYLRIEYDQNSNTIYISPENPNVKIVVNGQPLVVEGASTGGAAAPKPTPKPLTLAELRGKIVFLSDRDGGDFLSSGSYYAINPDGTGLEPLPYDETKELMSQVRPLEGFSPDHSKVVMGERDCVPSSLGATCALYILDTKLDAGQIFSDDDPSHGEWFIQKDKRAREPVWSPRNDYIVFVSNHEPPEGCRNTDNLFKGTIGQKPVIRRLTNFCGTQGGVGQPSFSPDGSQVVFWSSFDHKTADLYVIDVGADDTFDWRTAKPVRITGDEGNEWQPVWIK